MTVLFEESCAVTVTLKEVPGVVDAGAVTDRWETATTLPLLLYVKPPE